MYIFLACIKWDGGEWREVRSVNAGEAVSIGWDQGVGFSGDRAAKNPHQSSLDYWKKDPASKGKAVDVA